MPEREMERTPVSAVEDLDTLDKDEVQEGYQDGLDGWPAPGGNRSRSYWHGWRNGRVDGGHAQPDHAQKSLAHDYVRSNRPTGA